MEIQGGETGREESRAERGPRRAGRWAAGPVAAIHAAPEPSSAQSGKAPGSERAGFSSTVEQVTHFGPQYSHLPNGSTRARCSLQGPVTL